MGMRLLREFIDRMRGKKAPEKPESPRKAPEREAISQRAENKPAAAERPAVQQVQRRTPTEEDYEQWRKTLKGVTAYFVEQMPMKIPQEGMADDFGIAFKLKGTNNRAILVVECRNKTLRSFSVRVMPNGTDLSVMHYIKKGTNEELTAYLKDEANQDELLVSIRELSKRADQGFN